MPTQPHTFDEKPLDPLAETALEWLVHLHSGNETVQDWQEYEHWKTDNTEQVLASQAAEALWENIGPAVKRPNYKKAATQLLLVLVVCAGLFNFGVQQRLIESPASLLADHRTSTEAGKHITLADGSQIKMDASTSIDIDFTDKSRRVTVYKGQIHVDVTSDKTRPFYVFAADISVRALGTGFNVKRYAENVVVVVTEHSVQVSEDAAIGVASLKLKAGQYLQYNHETGFGSVAKADLTTLMAWRRGRLVFDNKPLGDVVQDMQRYSDSKVVFLSSDLKQLHVTGVFDSNDTDSILQAIESILPIKVRRLPWVTILQAKTDG